MNEHTNVFPSLLIPLVLIIVFVTVTVLWISYLEKETNKNDWYYECTLVKGKSPEYCLEIINGMDKIK